MKKQKYLKLMIAIIMAVVCAVFIPQTSHARTVYSASDIKSCKNIYADSNSTGAYLYGFNGNKLYSSMLLPGRYNRNISAATGIKNAMQCGNITYALYSVDNKTDKYGIIGLNMTDGSSKTYEFINVASLYKNSFSVSGDYAYFIRSDDTYSYIAAYSLGGVFKKKFSFGSNIYSLFNNNSSVYAMLYDGSIYKLSGTRSILVNKLNRYEDCFNSGIGWICTKSGVLVSLTDNSTKSVASYNENCVVCDTNGIFAKNGSRAVYYPKSGSPLYCSVENINYLLIYNDKTIAVTDNFSFTYISLNEYKSNTIDYTVNSKSSGINSLEIPDSLSVRNGKYLCGIKSGTTVTSFISMFSDTVTVNNSSGAAVTSGKIKTGYKLCYGNTSYTIIVMGDVTGEGNVKTNDITTLMNYFIGSISLDDIYILAADYNMDGTTDNKDLVLIARKAKE